jgi:hypothetical protein
MPGQAILNGCINNFNNKSIVDNSEEGFSKKMKKIGEAVFNVVGIPSSI